MDWGERDFLLIDSPPRTGDEHITILKTIPDALCIVVTTPQEILLADKGMPVVLLEGGFPAKRGFLELADNIAKRGPAAWKPLPAITIKADYLLGTEITVDTGSYALRYRR